MSVSLTKVPTVTFVLTVNTQNSTYTITVPTRGLDLLTTIVQGPFLGDRAEAIVPTQLPREVHEAILVATTSVPEAQRLLDRTILGYSLHIDSLMSTSRVKSVRIIQQTTVLVPAATVDVEAPAKVQTFEGAIFRDLDEGDLAFFQACEHFDWHYDASDDGSVWRRGVERKQELVSMKAGNPVREAIWTAWFEYNFTGRPFGKEKAPRPALDAGFQEV